MRLFDDLGALLRHAGEDLYAFLTPQTTALKADLAQIPAKPRKKRDTTKITQYMFDFIKLAYRGHMLHNADFPENKRTTMHLTHAINKRMGTTYSRTKLAGIWNDQVDRESLEPGEAYFDNTIK